MTREEQIRAIHKRDRKLLRQIACDEQARHVDFLHAKVRAATSRAERGRYITLRDDINLAWGEIMLWLDEDVTPELLDIALQTARNAAAMTAKVWNGEAGGTNDHPKAVSFFGLYMIDHMLQQRFAPPATERVAA